MFTGFLCVGRSAGVTDSPKVCGNYSWNYPHVIRRLSIDRDMPACGAVARRLQAIIFTGDTVISSHLF